MNGIKINDWRECVIGEFNHFAFMSAVLHIIEESLLRPFEVSLGRRNMTLKLNKNGLVNGAKRNDCGEGVTEESNHFSVMSAVLPILKKAC